MSTLYVVLLILAAFLVYQALVRAICKRFNSPAPAFIGRFLDSGLRRMMQPPAQLIERSGIKPGMTVLDLGCGSGAFTTYVARAVGERSKVYALDMQPAMLRQLQRKLAKPENQDLKNIELVNANAYEIPLPDESLDLVYMVTVLQEIPDKGKTLREIKRVLKPGGILAVTELLPDPDYAWRSTTIKICQREGFIIDASFGNIWNYTVRCRKPGIKEHQY